MGADDNGIFIHSSDLRFFTGYGKTNWKKLITAETYDGGVNKRVIGEYDDDSTFAIQCLIFTPGQGGKTGLDLLSLLLGMTRRRRVAGGMSYLLRLFNILS